MDNVSAPSAGRRVTIRRIDDRRAHTRAGRRSYDVQLDAATGCLVDEAVIVLCHALDAMVAQNAPAAIQSDADELVNSLRLLRAEIDEWDH
jgi:hypothetical protein